MRFVFKTKFYVRNMNKIVEPNKEFDFSGLKLSHPINLAGGAYFTKLEHYNKPLYIQTHKSVTKQGFVKNGKKYYCDLMFDKTAEEFIQWFENLEETCHQLIYQKKDDWFDGNLIMSEIESAFSSPIRIYKSGKNYLLRTQVKNTKDDIPVIKIYNEKQCSLTINDVTSETEIVSIIDIQGIKFTPRSFQLEIELKQVMVLDNEPIFENCVIMPFRKKNINQSDNITNNMNNNNMNNNMNTNANENTIIESIIKNKEYEHDDITMDNESTEINLTTNEINDTNDLDDTKFIKEEIAITFDELSEIPTNDNELMEINKDELYLDKNDESIKLKKPNQVYYELYKEARNKAKQAKKNAIIAYLEAKNIKKTYMLEINNDDEDSDFDAEIDETNESDLEGFS